jgi:photosystem II stability/assembly factor-like uncharacterized protein
MKWIHIVQGSVLLFGVGVLSGCSAPAGLKSTGSTAISLIKSVDGGTTFETKDTVTAQQTLGAEVLSLLVDKGQTSRVFVGTRTDGIYMSENSGDVWTKLNFPLTKVYGLVQDPTSPNVLYASGIWQDRAKLYRSEDSGNNWKEIYTEPANGPVITALAHHPQHSGELVVGLSTGVLVRTENGGQSWINIPKLSGAVIQLTFDPAHADWLYAVSGKKLFQSKDHGQTFANLSVQVSEAEKKKHTSDGNQAVNNLLGIGASVMTVAFDPTSSGVLYVGTEKEGIWKSVNSGVDWEALNVLESSKQYPIRAVAVNPFNSRELVYSGAQAIYKSTDGGTNWSTYQLNTKNTIGSVVYDPSQQGVLYLGFRAF